MSHIFSKKLFVTLVFVVCSVAVVFGLFKTVGFVSRMAPANVANKQISNTQSAAVIKDATFTQLPAVPGQPISWSVKVDASVIKAGQHILQLPGNAQEVKVTSVKSEIVPVKTSVTKSVKKVSIPAKIASAKVSVLTKSDRVKLAQIAKQNALSPASTALALSLQKQADQKAYQIASARNPVGSFFLSLGNTFSKTIGAVTAAVEDAITPPAPVQDAGQDTTQNTTSAPIVVDVTSPAPQAQASLEATPPADTVQPIETPVTETSATTTDVVDITSSDITASLIATSSSISDVTSTVTTTATTTATATTTVTTPTATTTQDVLVEYKTPAPVIAEALTDTGKIVTISDGLPADAVAVGTVSSTSTASTTGGLPHTTNVLAFTNIPEIYKVGQENKIKIKWKNNGDQSMEFHAYDLNNNGRLDYVEWTVPHLSEQTFEIIFISRAFELDENKEIVNDVYDQTKEKDGVWATVSDGHYVRATFNQILDSTKDNTIYAKPTDAKSTATIEVYPVYTDADGNVTEGSLVATFASIDHQGTYKVLLTNLQTPTDVFDLKVIGNIDIDWIVDPAVTYYNSTTGGAQDTAAAWTITQTPRGAGGDGVPTTGDTVNIDANGANITAGTAAVFWGALTLSGGTYASGAVDVTVSSFTLSGGTLTGSGAWTINGDLIYSSGTNSHTGVWTQGTGNLGWTKSGEPGRIMNYVVAANAAITLTSNVFMAKATVPSTATMTLGTYQFYPGFFSYTANNTVSLAGNWSSSGGNVTILNNANSSNNGIISIGSVPLIILETGGFGGTWTQTGAVSCGTLQIKSDTAGIAITFTMSNNLTAGAVTLGDTAATDRSGVLNLGGGTHTIASIARGNAANLNNAINFGTSTVSVSGNIDFTGIAVTSGTSTVTLTGTGAGGTLTSAGNSFYNLTQNGAGGTYTLQDPLVVSGNLSLTAGTLDTKSGSNYAVTIGSADPVNGNFSQATTAKFTARSSLVTFNGNGTFTADGTLDSTQFNAASLTMMGTSTLFYNNNSASYSNGFNNLTVGQNGNTTTMQNHFTVKSVVTVGSGTLKSTVVAQLWLTGNNPLSFDVASHLSVGALYFFGSAQTIPTLTNGYDCGIVVNGGSTIVTQIGGVVINSTNYLSISGGSFANRIETWKTDGYNLTVGGYLQIGNGNDTGLKQLDATHNGSRTSTITVVGGWINTGTGTTPSQFIADNSTVILTGTASTHTITSGATNSPFYNLTQNGSGGTYTLQDPLVVNGTLTLTAGTFAGGTQTITNAGFNLNGGTFTGSGAMTVNGNLIYTSGTNSHTGAWTQGTGNLSWIATSLIKDYTAAANATITLTNLVYSQKTFVPATVTVSLGANVWRPGYVTTSNNQVSLEGTWSATSGYVRIAPAANVSNSLPISIGSVQLQLFSQGFTWTQTGSINCGTLVVLTTFVGQTSTATVSNIAVGAIVLGDSAGSTGSGVLNFNGGTHTIASIARGNAANLGNAINFGTSTVNITGSADFTGIAVSNTSATLNFTATSGTPTLKTAGATLPNIVVNNAGVTSFTALDAVTAAGFRTANTTGVKYNDGGFAHNIGAGGILIGSSSTLTSTGNWTVTTTTSVAVNATNSNQIRTLTINNGVTVTPSGTFYAMALVNNGALVLGTNTLVINYIASSPVTGTGTFTGTTGVLRLAGAGGNFTQGALTTACNVEIRPYTLNSLTFTGNLDVGAKSLQFASASNNFGIVDMGNNSLTAGAVTLGVSDLAGRKVDLRLNGTVNIASLARANASDTGNLLTLGSSTVSVSGNIDFTGIAVTSGTSTVNLTGTGAGGTLTSAGNSFYNLTQNGSGGTYTLQDSLVVSGNLTLTAGTLDTKSAVNNSVTLAGSFSQETTAKFTARSSTITVNGNGTFTADGTLDSTQYNAASLVLNGVNTLTYGHNVNILDINNLTVGQGGNTTTLAQHTAVNNLTIGSGTLAGSSYTLRVKGSSPLSFNDASNITISSLRLEGTNQTIPSLLNGYTGLTLGTGVVTQTGDVLIKSGYNFWVAGGSVSTIVTWKTDGYNLTVGGNFSIGSGADTGLKKLDTTNYTNPDTNAKSTISVGGNWLNYGTGTAPSQFIADNSTVIFNATASGKTIKSGAINSPFKNLTFNGTGGVWTLLDNLVASGNILHTAGTLSSGGKNITTTNGGNFTISDGALVTASGLVSTLGNQVVVNGTLSPDAAGTYTTVGAYNGAPYYQRGSDNYFIWWSGSSNSWRISTTLGTLSVGWATGTTITSSYNNPIGGATGVPAVSNVAGSEFVGSTWTVAGAFSAAGHLGSLLTLNPASAWYLNVAGVGSASYVNVAYSNASGGTAIAQTNSTDSGYNTNWLFNLAPNAPTLVSPANASFTANNKPTLSANYSDPDTGDTGTTNYRISSSTLADCVDNASIVASGTSAQTSSNNQNTTWTPSSLIGSDSTYYWCAQNNDGTATSAWAQMGSFTLDTTAPTVSDNVPSGWQNSDIAVILACDDSTGGNSGCSKVFYTLDGSAPDTNSSFVDASGAWEFTYSTSTISSATLKYRGLDTIGNLGNTVTAVNSLQIDKVAPVISNVNPASGSDISRTGQTVTFTLNKAGDCRFAVSAKSYDGMSGDTSCSVQNGIQMTCGLSNLVGSGDNNIYLACKDYLGNKDTAESATHVVYRIPRSPSSFGGGFAVVTVTPVPTNVVYSAPAGPFGVTINDGASVVNERKVTLKLSAGAGATAVVISNNPDFSQAVTIPFQASYEYDLCHGSSNCLDQNYIVYAKFLSSSGAGSPVFSAGTYLKTSSFVDQTGEVIKQFEKNISDVIGIFQPKKNTVLNLPPIAISVPKETPFAFNHVWTLTLASMQDFVFASLPQDLQNVIQKFPQVAETLKKVGVTRMSQIGQLEVAKISLPGLAESVGLPSTQSFSVNDLSSVQSKKVPSNVVFARAGENNLDLNVKLSITNQGNIAQTLNTVQGRPLTLAIKPDKPASGVKGYLIFKSNRVGVSAAGKKFVDSQTQVQSGSLAASVANALEMNASVNVGSGGVDQGSANTPDLVLSQFDYKDSGNGIWTADVTSPSVLGQYELRTVVNYKNKATKPEQVSMIVLVDPEGYVFEKLKDGREVRVSGANVSIYWLDSKTGQYELWPAKDFRQQNPQTTDVTGRYAFLVPPGSYYLKATGISYSDYQSEVFKVEENKGVFMNIEFKAKTSWLSLFNPQVLLLGGIFIALVCIFMRMRSRRLSVFKN